jgi:hypothetical protein
VASGGVLRGRRAIGRRARIAGDRGGRFGFLAIDLKPISIEVYHDGYFVCA